MELTREETYPSCHLLDDDEKGLSIVQTLGGSQEGVRRLCVPFPVEMTGKVRLITARTI
ncbi:hypothetical protein VAWG002_28400 [Aeromonas veronii]|nr:hypothetical protein VAWG002_28400 [Aeromonas veronii]